MLSPADRPRPDGFFSMLTEAETGSLLQRAVTKKFAKGKTIFRKGDPGTGMYFVREGYVAVSIESASGNDLPLRVYGPGEVLGDIAIFDGKGRISGALALHDASLRFIERRKLEAILAARPALALQIVDYLCARLRRIHDDGDAHRSLNMPARLARLLLSLDRRFALPDGKSKLPSLRFSRAEIAALLGLSREWVGRELGKWQGAHIIEIGRKRLVVLDRPALERIVARGDSRTNGLCGRIRSSGRALRL
jgi:CRP/FNR family transcriptional regulator, cyclic AMP receptor protein